MDYVEFRKRICERVREKMDFRRDFTDEEVETIIDDTLLEQEDLSIFSVEERILLHREVFDALRRLDILQSYVDDPSITEIMINGTGHMFVEKSGVLSEVSEQFESEERLRDVIQQIVGSCNRVVNEASPIVDARLSNGSRVNVVLPPISLVGPVVTIRRFPDKPITMEKLVLLGSLSKDAAAFLQQLVKARYNIFISGGTGSGKTTFLNALSAAIPSGERVITIEDSAELQLQGIPNLVRLETRNSNAVGCEEVTIRDLIRASLRMRPDRIVVGEVRGAEALDMLQCMNTGHDGSMSTGHANSAPDMLTRLENMVLMGMELPLQAIRQQIASGIDILVHLGRLRDRSRRVLEISEVEECVDGKFLLSPIYRFREQSKSASKEEGDGGENQNRVQGILEQVGSLKNREKLRAAGVFETALEEG